MRLNFSDVLAPPVHTQEKIKQKHPELEANESDIIVLNLFAGRQQYSARLSLLTIKDKLQVFISVS